MNGVDIQVVREENKFLALFFVHLLSGDFGVPRKSKTISDRQACNMAQHKSIGI
jgi:hypothetical protein